MHWHCRRLWYGLGITLLILIAVASLMPVPDGPTGNDKLAHIIMYAIPSAWFSLITGDRSKLLRIFTGLTAYGLLMELLQGLTGYRSTELADALANAIGALIGLLIVFTPARQWLVAIDGRLARLF